MRWFSLCKFCALKVFFDGNLAIKYLGWLKSFCVVKLNHIKTWLDKD
jgi:hypothetical protein